MQPTQLNPKGLVISRRRKKWKFAHFDAWDNCFTHSRADEPKVTLKNLQNYLGNKPLILELAAGNAQFSLELALQHLELNFIAVDVKSDRLYASAKKSLEEGVSNIAFLNTHINEIDVIFEKRSIEEIWLTFPDPFPKKRSAKHRLTYPDFLKKYKMILKDKGVMKFKTDDRKFFEWSLEQFALQKWHVQELSNDLHESDLPNEYKIKTYYEQKFTDQGMPINFVSLAKQ